MQLMQFLIWYISFESYLSFYKVNLDDGIWKNTAFRGVCFVRSASDALVAAGGIRIIYTIVPMIKLRAARKGLKWYILDTSRAFHIYLEGDSLIALKWRSDSSFIDIQFNLLVRIIGD